MTLDRGNATMRAAALMVVVAASVGPSDDAAAGECPVFFSDFPCCLLTGIGIRCPWECYHDIISSDPVGAFLLLSLPGHNGPFSQTTPGDCVFRKAYCGSAAPLCALDPPGVYTTLTCPNYNQPTGSTNCTP